METKTGKEKRNQTSSLRRLLIKFIKSHLIGIFCCGMSRNFLRECGQHLKCIFLAAQFNLLSYLRRCPRPCVQVLENREILLWNHFYQVGSEIHGYVPLLHDLPQRIRVVFDSENSGQGGIINDLCSLPLLRLK